MQTIFDKIDPNYTNCISGVCEHAEHKVNSLWWIIPLTFLIYLYGKIKIKCR